MHKSIAIVTIAVSILAAGACRHDGGQDRDASMDGTDTASSRRDRIFGSVHGIMVEKLDHADALLEAISLESFARIEHHADALTEVSRRSDWQVHTTVAYGVFSEQFRQTTMDIARHARRNDLDAAASAYVDMVRSCLDCHAYLRREGLIRDVPGRVTMADPHASALVR